MYIDVYVSWLSYVCLCVYPVISCVFPVIFNSTTRIVAKKTGVMLENMMKCKIAHFCTFLCAILTNSVRNFYMLTRYTTLDAKITHRAALTLSLKKEKRGLG